jgi:hypothetical protein
MSWNLMIPAKTRTYLTAAALLVGTSLSLSTGAVAQGSLIVPGGNYGIGSSVYQPEPWVPGGQWRTGRIGHAGEVANPVHRRAARINNSHDATVGSAAR